MKSTKNIKSTQSVESLIEKDRNQQLNQNNHEDDLINLKLLAQKRHDLVNFINKVQHYRSKYKKNLTKNNLKYKQQILRAQNKSVQKFFSQKPDNHELIINDKKIYFPFQPYPQQQKYMQKIIQCLDGQPGTNAVLQSPTGTGKTMCLLSSILSWIYIQKKKGTHIKLIYLSRTHSQLNQVINQLKRTCFKPTMVALSSRDFSCIHPEIFQIERSAQKIQGCFKIKQSYKNLEISQQQQVKNQLRKHNNPDRYCQQNNINLDDLKQQIKQQQKIKKNIQNKNKSLQHAHCPYYMQKTESLMLAQGYLGNKVLNLKDFNEYGKKLQFCPYFYSFQAHQMADFITMPYNYLFMRKINKLFSQTIKNSIIVFDEAHNVSQAACQGQQFNLSSEFFQKLQSQLIRMMFSSQISRQLFTFRKNFFKYLDEINGIIQDIKLNIINLIYKLNIKQSYKKQNKIYQQESTNKQQKIFSKIFNHFQNKQHIQALLYGYYLKSVSNKSKNKQNQQLLIFVQILNVLIQQLKLIKDSHYTSFQKISQFISNCLMLLNKHSQQWQKNLLNHYRIKVIVTFKKQDYENIQKFQIQFKCLSPQIAFKQLCSCGPRNIILASGTLSPLDTWQVQLGIKIPIMFSNEPVITANQIRTEIIMKNNYKKNYNFSMKQIQQYPQCHKHLIQDLTRVVRTIPNGVIAICPNYKTINKIKSIIQDKGFDLFRKQVLFQNKRDLFYIQQFKQKSQSGALLFAVCRGKVCEGIDFPDKYCRGVIFIGIPFANIYDPLTIQKKNYYKIRNLHVKNDRKIEWDKWYFTQTMRAVNQGIGRVIRHKNDYGAIFLIDSRYQEQRFQKGLSKWARLNITVQQDGFTEQVIRSIQYFYTECQYQYETFNIEDYLEPGSYEKYKYYKEHDIPFTPDIIFGVESEQYNSYKCMMNSFFENSISQEQQYQSQENEEIDICHKKQKKQQCQ